MGTYNGMWIYSGSGTGTSVDGYGWRVGVGVDVSVSGCVVGVGKHWWEVVSYQFKLEELDFASWRIDNSEKLFNFREFITLT
jgi:hypothetical protein